MDRFSEWIREETRSFCWAVAGPVKDVVRGIRQSIEGAFTSLVILAITTWAIRNVINWTLEPRALEFGEAFWFVWLGLVLRAELRGLRCCA